MEISKIVSQLEQFQIRSVCARDTPTYIQTHKMLPPGQPKLYDACLYVGFVSQLPDNLQVTSNLSIICIEDTPLSEQITETPELNLFLLPPNIDQFDVLNKIADILIDEAWIVASMRRILDELYAGSGLQALASTASNVFGNPVFINDASFKLLAIPQEVTFENAQMEQQKELGYVHPDLVAAMRRDGIDFEMGAYRSRAIVFPRPGSDESWLFCGIRLHDIPVGIIGIPDLNHPHMPRDIELVERFAKIVAIEMEKDDFYRDSRGVKFGYLLSDLLSGKMHSRRTIEQRALSVRWKVLAWNRIITIVDPNGFIPAERAQNIANRVQSIIHGARWTTFRHNLVFFVSRNERNGLLDVELERLASFLEASSLGAGVSMPFADLTESTRYYRQSIRAVDAGILVRIPGPVFTYEDMITYYAAQTLLKRNDADEFCPESIAIIRAYDAEHGTELCPTLEQYLLHVGDPVTAAKALHVHRNTLLYRVNKVRELTGMDLSDGNERLAAQLYFRLEECRRGALQMERGGTDIQLQQERNHIKTYR